ncbi:MAG: protein phosphatase 2C domain-containing protein [Lachnospiraceae bacterium]|nr:protein phosphatase 2C domain-containing protein [Lachnospiraceae bacterium]
MAEKKYYLYSDIGDRPENEDTAFAGEAGSNLIAALADGLGGQGDGSKASRLVIDRIREIGADGTFPTVSAIEEVFASANEALIAAQLNDFHMKTTAVYLCVCDDKAIWAHIGDTRLYHLVNGHLQDYTIDHSVAQLAVTLGSITREEIPSYPGRSRLVKAMGVEGDVPDVHEQIQLRSGKHGFLICSDGLWEYLSDSDVERAFSDSSSPEECMEMLLTIRNEHEAPDGENDNNSAIIVMTDVS